MTCLETLGGKRGSVAHVSTSKTMITLAAIYPEDARDWVRDAVEGAVDIEVYLATCRDPVTSGEGEPGRYRLRLTRSGGRPRGHL
jgi:hypothetical protein